MYTVKQLSTLAGVTPRTLHHYDRIDLLKPEEVGENGYRYYGQQSLLRLQQILFYRELGFSLESIRDILNRPDFRIVDALEEHRSSLQGRVRRLERLIRTVNETIQHLKGETKMNDRRLFAGFGEEQQEEYARQAEQLYDPETVRASNRKWKSYPVAKKQAILEEGRQVYLDMAAVMSQGPASPEVQAIVERWRVHMDYFWTPGLDQLLELAAMYSQSPDFKANFDQIHPQLADFMGEAVRVYVENQR
ncbi:MAG: MerR family transcriptional regulator [Anaerolineales bacterium]|nr:MerR family transcriptional regulator [Anaerolineales bacterium]